MTAANGMSQKVKLTNGKWKARRDGNYSGSWRYSIALKGGHGC
jgi:hypothetical protein